MIHNEIAKSIEDDKKYMDDITSKLNIKWQTIQMSKTPKQVCDQYIELENKLKNSVNKKRKDIEREMDKIRNEYRTLLDDVQKVRDLIVMDIEYNKQKETIGYMEQFIKSQTDAICNIMVEHGFLNSMGEEYEFTKMGMVASNIAEVHPLPISKIMFENAYFADFTSKQLVGLFSCFTDVKIPSDQRASVPLIDNHLLKKTIQDLAALYGSYESRENEFDVRTGIRYESAMIYDMIQYSIDWCDCETEEECKYFIQSVISEKEISIGDFTKAMMKIVTISKEFMNVCEILGAIDLLYKLKQIEGMVLKYVLTSQSLYI
jgi:hypothetical protein